MRPNPGMATITITIMQQPHHPGTVARGCYPRVVAVVENVVLFHPWSDLSQHYRSRAQGPRQGFCAQHVRDVVVTNTCNPQAEMGHVGEERVDQFEVARAKY